MKQFAFKALLVTALISSASAAYAQTRYQYQSPEVWSAWAQGYQGQGSVINVHDDFATRNVNGTTHGAWVSLFSQTTAPQASVVGHQWEGQAVIGITPNKLNIFNSSYSISSVGGTGTYMASYEAIIRYGQRGQALVVKAAGNDAIPVGAVIPRGQSAGLIDGMNVRLAGQQSAILVGALSANGTTSSSSPMRSTAIWSSTKRPRRMFPR